MLWICTGCTAAYSVGAVRCPQCDGTEYVEEGAEDMAKITVHGGPSNAAAEAEAGEDVSAGTSSSTSSETPQPSDKQSETQGRSPVRGAGSRSKRAHAAPEGGTAGSTATSGRKTAGDPSNGPSK